MLYSLLLNFSDQISFLNVFKFLTVRTGLAMFTAMIVVFIVGNPLSIIFLQNKFIILLEKMGQRIILLKKLVHLQWEAY